MGQKGPLSLKSVTHILQWWNLTELYLTQRKSKKYMNHVTHSLNSADISFFHRKSANFAISRNTDIDCISIHNFYLFWLFLILYRFFVINMVKILMMSTKMATLGLLKMKVFWNKGYYVICFAYDVAIKILSHDSNCIGDVVMWSKFGNPSICIREVIITSIL